MAAFTWNHDRELISPGKHQHSIGVGWRNYLNSGVWQPINTAIANDRTVTGFPGNVQFPLTAQGDMTASFGHKFSMKRKIDEGNEHNPDDALTMSVRVLSDSNPTGHIDDNGYEMVYPNAWPTANLRMGVRHGRAARIEKIVEIHSMPAGNSQYVTYQFEVTSPLAKMRAGKGHGQRPWAGNASDSADLNGASAFIALGDSPHRGAVIRTPKCWYYMPDGSKVEKNVRVNFVVKPNLETALATKYVLRADIQEALNNGSALFTDATITPDANPETNSCDGYVECANAALSWAGLLAASGTSVDDTATFSNLVWVAAFSTTSLWNRLNRSHVYFDTSSLTDTVTAASTSYDCSGFVGSDGLAISPSFNVVKSTSSGTTSLATSDYLTLETTRLSDSPVAYHSGSPRVRSSVTFNAAGRASVNMSGLSRYVWIMDEYDVGGSAPAWSNSTTYHRFSYSEDGPTNTPKLEVTTEVVSVNVKSFSSTVSSGVSKGIIK